MQFWDTVASLSCRFSSTPFWHLPQEVFLCWCPLLPPVNMTAIVGTPPKYCLALQMEEDFSASLVTWQGCLFLSYIATPSLWEGPGLFLAFSFSFFFSFSSHQQHCQIPFLSLVPSVQPCSYSADATSGSAALFPWRLGRARAFLTPGSSLRLTQIYFIFSWDFNWPWIHALRISAGRETSLQNQWEILRWKRSWLL